ncbi:hypothetical protein MCOR02_006917 [Pyricularia oryzae]|nr:hypothetical protein MCOR02_006917 [Pyricularia oryzae]KAI6305610.1 hypothetical protein MCOR34_008486 [Pyricularia oryzae]KAI6473124.1 hypothetical protein MCOR17_002729 [Pyricularia oryzae]
MASPAPDQLDVLGQAALDALDGIQDSLDPTGSESSLDLDPTESSSDSYSVPSDLDDDEWSDALGWDWDRVYKNMFDSINWKTSMRDVIQDPNVPKPLRPPPQKDNFNGEFSYIEYIPGWTSPKFDSDKEYFGVEGQDEVTFQRWKYSFWARLRPAQALVDSFYNPTEMAKRYGIYPNRQDGRSRLSPADAASRKVQLDKPISMPNGTLKSFVDVKHYEWVRSHEYLNQENASNVAAGQTFESFLVERSKANANVQQQDSTEVYEKLLLLHKQIADDQEYQRAFFKEFTTDELIAQKVLHFGDDVKYELEGVLHPLLKREKWLTTEDQGGDIDSPKLLWSFGGNRGEWSAHDATVWEALQPALQLLTRFLRLDVPVFTSMMDYRSQRPFDQRVIHRGLHTGWRQRIAWFRDVDPDKTWQCLATLHNIGFNSVEWVETILQERLELIVGSAYRDRDGRCSSRHFAWTNLEGQVHCFHSAGIPNAKTLRSDWRIRIEVAAEGIWPLLSPDFSKAEKLTCSFALAVTMFHEFAHAIGMALETMRLYPDLFSRKEDEVVSRISREEYQQLLIAQQEMPPFGSEPFFENHTQAEVGFAVETETFGGTVYPIFHNSWGNTPDNFGILTTALSLTRWPIARAIGTDNLSIDFLPEWTPPVLDIQIPLPYDVSARVFTKNFWDVDYKRFGNETLKLYPEGKVTKGAIPRMAMHMLPALAPIFGKKRAEWMTQALRQLRTMGFDTISQYIDEVCRQYALPKITRRNWYLESHRWTFDKARIKDCLDGLRMAGNNFLLAFAKLTQSEEQRLQAVNDFFSTIQQPETGPAGNFEAYLELYIGQLTRTTDKAFSVFLAWLTALERVMANRLQQSQFLVRSYLQLDVSDRCIISEGRGKHLRAHMRLMITRPYNKVKLCLAALVNFIQSRMTSEAATKYVQELEGPYGHLQAIYRMTKQTMDYLKPANESNNVGGAGASLAYLTSSNLDPVARAERLKPIFMADLEFVRSEEVKQIVRVFDSIFRAQDGKEILPKDQATVDAKIAELSNLFRSRNLGGASADDAGRSSGDPRSGPGRGERGPANMFRLGRKTIGGSRVTKQKTTTTKKLQATVSRLFDQDRAGKSSNSRYTFQTSTALRTAATRTGTSQASLPFTQYASPNTTMRGFPTTQTPGQPPAFATPAPTANPSDDGVGFGGQPKEKRRFWIFPHPFADQATVSGDLTPAARDWGAQIAQAQLPNDLQSYRGEIAEMLQFDGSAAASALMAMAALGPPSENIQAGHKQQAQAVHEAVAQAVDATLPASAAAGPDSLNSAAASMQPVQMLTATWSAAWAPGGAGAGSAAALSAMDQLAEYATRRMVQEGLQSQTQTAGQGDDGAADAPHPQAEEVPRWTQLSTVDEILNAVTEANYPDAMETDDYQNEDGQ